MPPIPEVQRLLARGPDSLPSLLLVDCAAIARWVAETDPRSDPWPQLIEVGTRTSRRICWLTGPNAVEHVATDASAMIALNARLSGKLPGSVGWSNEPAGAVAAAIASSHRVGLVTAAVEGRPYELWALGAGVSVVLDVATGRQWNYETAFAEFGPPARLPLITAITEPEPGTKPIVPELARYADKVRDAYVKVRDFIALGIAQAVDNGDLPPRPVDLLFERFPEVFEEEARRRGTGREDPDVRRWVQQLSTAVPTGGTANTIYVAAAVREGQLERLEAGRHGAADGHSDCVQLLRVIGSTYPEARWFVPHGLDLLDVMVDEGLLLPGRVADPALGAFIHHPDLPTPLEDLLDELHALPPVVRHWLNDVRREEDPLPPKHLGDVVDLLPALDQAVDVVLRQNNLHNVAEDDVACTLPALAIIERQGIHVGAPPGGWAAALQQHRQKLQPALERAASFLHKDPLRAGLEEIVGALKREHGLLPNTHWFPRLDPKEEFERYVALGNADACAIAQVRCSLSDEGALKWLGLLAGGRSILRGSLFPSTTGRWYFRNLPLGGLPRKPTWAANMRRHLVAPPGMCLVRADWNAYEARLFTAITGAPELLQAAHAADFLAALGDLLCVDRDDAKSSLYAILYGQKRAGFQQRMATMTLTQAGALYDKLVTAVPATRAYRTQVLRVFKTHGEVRTHNGWRRSPIDPEPWKRNSAAANLPVQGLAADILRWVLRELARKLPPLGSHLVFQLHDEIVVACPPTVVQDVRTLLSTTMDAGVNTSGLLPRAVPLPVKIKDGTTWSDLL